jgi:hypothetical protein
LLFARPVKWQAKVGAIFIDFALNVNDYLPIIAYRYFELLHCQGSIQVFSRALTFALNRLPTTMRAMRGSTWRSALTTRHFAGCCQTLAMVAAGGPWL